MTIAVAAVSILAFLIAFWAAKVVPAALKATNTATESLKVLSSKELDDEAKEEATRKAAISLLVSVASIAIRSTVSLIAAGIPIYIAGALNLVPVKDTLDFLSRWDVIVVSSLLITALFLIGRRIWPTG